MSIRLIHPQTSSINGLVPLGLVQGVNDLLASSITQDGLCPLRISWEQGRISSMEILRDSIEFDLKLILPRLIEPHTHLDKAFTWRKFPNIIGTYNEALNQNYKEHKTRNQERVKARASHALNLALRNGIRAVRSHIDSFGYSVEETWEVLYDLQDDWKDFVELQLVALVPIDFWSRKSGEIFATKLAIKGGLMGGVVVPPIRSKELRNSLYKMLRLANNLGCGIDLHIDEASIEPAAGLMELVQLLEQFDNQVPITCSHVSSMGLLSSRKLLSLADRMAEQRINVVALPLTNAWLLERSPAITPSKRPLAPIRQLQRAGVKVALGWDNVQDPWFPLGRFDPLTLMAFSMPLAQLAPWQRLGLSPFTTAAASLLGLAWNGTFAIGGPADLMVLDCSSWVEALSSPPKRKVLINGDWLDE